MKIVPTTSVAALLMLRQTAAREAAPSARAILPTLAPPGADPRNLAANTLLGALAQGPGTEAAARAKVNDSLFGVDRVSGEKLLMRRFEQLGEVLGLKRDDYANFADFAAATKDVAIKLTAKPGDERMIDAIGARMKLDAETIAQLKEQKTPDLLFNLIEKYLKLDQIGLSLTRLVDAGQDLQGDDAERIIEILQRERGEAAKDKTGRSPVVVTKDEAGLYRVEGGTEG